MSQVPLTLDPNRAQPATRSAWEAVHVAAGLLLIVAATLKAYPAVMPGPSVALNLRLMDLAMIEFELALGAMLVLNYAPSIAWGLAMAAYTIFAAVSVQKVMAGAKSCGCFGPAAVNPKLMVLADVTIVALLLIAGPRPRGIVQLRFLRRALTTLVVLLMFLSAAGVAFAAIPKRGLVPDAVPGSVLGSHDFGRVTRDTARCEHTFTVRNTASTPIRITKYQSSCGCTTADVPTTPIPPGGAVPITVRADWSGVEGATASTVTLHTDHFWTPRVALTVHAEVGPAPTTSP